MLKYIVHIILFTFSSQIIYSQIPSDYTIGTWYKFKDAAVSYTFDDLTDNQLPVAMPIFDQYNFPMTFNVVINWTSSWSSLADAAANGHEIASHTVSHATLSNISINEQITELENSQNTINSNIPGNQCVTIAYPNCNSGDQNTISQYYIAGRTCSGQINSASPSNMYTISSIICGSESQNTSANNLNNHVQSALNSNGWSVFLFHGIDGDGGYSSFQSSELQSHLSYMDTHYDNYWIGTFASVAQYIQERNSASISESTISSDSLSVTISDNVSNSLYNVPLSIRKEIPQEWEDAQVYHNENQISSNTITINNTRYIEFEAVPDDGTIYIANTAQSAEPPTPPQTVVLHEGWNIIGCPYGNTNIENALNDIWNYVIEIKTFNEFYETSNTSDLNTLQEVTYGQGYIIKVSQDCEFNW
ncbi:MAG: polysaccharide deacetylase family protein [Bacteroidales bacterium]